MSIGLCLSGGGVKGAAHIGVLQALKEEGISIDYISGCSSGSIVASLYAMDYSPMQILHMFTTYCSNISDFDKLIPFKIIGMAFTGKLKLRGLAKGKKLENIIREFCFKKNVNDISDIKIPLAIPTVDIKSGEVVYFLSKELSKSRSFDDEATYEYKGNLASIVRASSSVPCVFEPKYLSGRYLIDGGVRMNSPVEILKQMGADRVITVSFEENQKTEIDNMNIVSVTMKSFDIMGHEVNNEQLDMSDYIISPKMGNVSLLECSKVSYAANIGYSITKHNIENIKQTIYG